MTFYTRSLYHPPPLNKRNYREELHLHTDRDLYIIGEQLWLKVFKINTYSKKPDNFPDGQSFDGIVNFITKKDHLEGLEFNSAVFRRAYSGFNRKVILILLFT